jgi:hypothetical protein
MALAARAATGPALIHPCFDLLPPMRDLSSPNHLAGGVIHHRYSRSLASWIELHPQRLDGGLPAWHPQHNREREAPPHRRLALTEQEAGTGRAAGDKWPSCGIHNKHALHLFSRFSPCGARVSGDAQQVVPLR